MKKKKKSGFEGT